MRRIWQRMVGEWMAAKWCVRTAWPPVRVAIQWIAEKRRFRGVWLPVSVAIRVVVRSLWASRPFVKCIGCARGFLSKTHLDSHAGCCDSCWAKMGPDGLADSRPN